MNTHSPLPSLLKKHAYRFSPVVPLDLNHPNVLKLDLTAGNPDLTDELIRDTALFTEYIFGRMRQRNTPVAIGGYNENRIIYRRSLNYAGAEPRSVHLGIDIWCEASTPVCSPLEGQVHSFRNNVGFGDYGPTVILQHQLEGQRLYSLHGHLSAQSLTGLYPGKPVASGETIGTVGDFPVNGDWPPHLHFQLIRDMGNLTGDFPGVAAISRREYYLDLCPDPGIILRLSESG
jgi:peptidoglycan LD-endopeptidase LytH